MGIEVNSRLREIPVYPAAETYAYGGELAKLASNETPWPPHPAVEEAIRREIGTLNRYPDPEATKLRRALADRHGVGVERVAVGNGSCEILLAAAEAMLEPGAEIVYAWPSFSMYPHLDRMTGAKALAVPLREDGRHDLEAMAREVTVATRILIVCNPNNPTATALPPAEIDAFLSDLPRNVTAILDEAYIELSLLQDPDESVALLERHPNLVLLRTFSKLYGLCGLRIGYALGPPELREAVDRVRQPFSVNALAQAAAAEALAHEDEIERRIELLVAERLFVEEALAERGLETTESQANFSWVALGDRDEAAVMRALGERGVVVRAGAHLGGPGHIRVTYGTHAENERFLEALGSIIHSS